MRTILVLIFSAICCYLTFIFFPPTIGMIGCWIGYMLIKIFNGKK